MGRTIHERLSAIQAAMPPVPKSRTNTQQGFKFRGIDDALEVLVPLLAEHQVFVVPTVLERIAETRSSAKGNPMNAVNLRVRFTFYGPDGDHVSAEVWGEGVDHLDKATSKAHTMSYKSCLFQVFAISGEDDPDAESPGQQDARAKTSASRKPRAGDADKAARAAVRERLAKRFDGDVDAIKAHLEQRFGAGASTSKLTSEQLSELIDNLDDDAEGS